MKRKIQNIQTYSPVSKIIYDFKIFSHETYPLLNSIIYIVYPKSHSKALPIREVIHKLYYGVNIET